MILQQKHPLKRILWEKERIRQYTENLEVFLRISEELKTIV